MLDVHQRILRVMNPKYRLMFNREGIYVYDWCDATTTTRSSVIRHDPIKIIKIKASTEVQIFKINSILQRMIDEGKSLDYLDSMLDDVERFSAL